MNKHTAYYGKKVAYVELAQNEYVNIVMVDGDRVVITDEGQLIVTIGTDRFAPECWDFVRAKSDIKYGLYLKGGALVPKLHPTISTVITD